MLTLPPDGFGVGVVYPPPTLSRAIIWFGGAIVYCSPTLRVRSKKVAFGKTRGLGGGGGPSAVLEVVLTLTSPLVEL